MDQSAQRHEVDDNYDAFQRLLSGFIDAHRNQFALMRDKRVIGFFKTPGEANRSGLELYGDTPFSIQEVTDEPIDLGFYSHVAV